MMFKVSNPDAKAAYEKHRDSFKGRAVVALRHEGLDAPDAVLISQLADIAAMLDLRGGGGSAEPHAQLERSLVGQLNTMRSDGQGVRRALRSLDNALSKCSESTKIEIAEGLKAADIEPEGLEKGLVMLQEIVSGLGNERARKFKRGQVATERTGAIHRAWLLLLPLGVGLRAGSRIIAWLLDGDCANHERIYSAIHEFRAKG